MKPNLSDAFKCNLHGLEEEIMRSRTPGYMRMLTRSHRFVIPVQTRRFKPISTGN